VILVHLLFILLVIVALLIQLVTPVVLNIPVIAFCVLILLITYGFWRRARRAKKVPIVAGFALLIQSLLFALSVAILVVVTIPHESPEDSPAVVQGIRRMLVSYGLIEKPQNTAPAPAKPNEEKKAPENFNAPDAGKVEIKIDEPTGAPAAQHSSEAKP